MAGSFELHQLLAGPVVAMNDAQAEAAARFYEIFERFAFEPEAARTSAEASARHLRVISFVAERPRPDGGMERREISMPLLQMIPMAGVGIDAATLRFAVALTEEPASQGGASPAQRPPRGALPAQSASPVLRGRIAPTSGGEQSGNLQVEIQLRQMDLPGGYLDLLAETQGAVSRPRTADQAENPLFEARWRDAPGPASAKDEIRAVAEVTIGPHAAGDEGIEIAVAGSPSGALSLVTPASPIRMSHGVYSLRIAARRSGRSARGELGIVLRASSSGVDGPARTHEVLLPIPHSESGR